MTRMVEDMVAARLADLQPIIDERVADAVRTIEASIPTQPPEEPLLDLRIPPKAPMQVAAPTPPPVPSMTRAEIDTRVETAVAARFAKLGVTELVGAVTALVGRMDEVIGATMRMAQQPVVVQQGTAEAEARWATERQAFDTLLSEAGEQTSTANAERDSAQSEVQRLRKALNDLRRDGVSTNDDEQKWPEDLDGLADWIEANPLPNVVVTTKAYRSMRKVRYQDMERLCRTLVLLNGAYVDMRAGEDGARERWEDGLKELRIENKKQTQMGKSIRNGSEYRFEHESRRWEMDYHIRGNESVHNEHDRLLRIYFAFDKEEGRVLIGHMPTHLTTIDS
jgi:hypothetical protein